MHTISLLSMVVANVMSKFVVYSSDFYVAIEIFAKIYE